MAARDVLEVPLVRRLQQVLLLLRRKHARLLGRQEAVRGQQVHVGVPVRALVGVHVGRGNVGRGRRLRQSLCRRRRR